MVRATIPYIDSNGRHSSGYEEVVGQFEATADALGLGEEARAQEVEARQLRGRKEPRRLAFRPLRDGVRRIHPAACASARSAVAAHESDDDDDDQDRHHQREQDSLRHRIARPVGNNCCAMSFVVYRASLNNPL